MVAQSAAVLRRDLLRISDARMSGTHYGSCVLHVSPESAVGGPLALVQDGDLIELDLPARTLTLCVHEDTLAQRRAAWQAAPMVDRVQYDEMGLFHENAAEFALPYAGPPAVRREAVAVGPDRQRGRCGGGKRRTRGGSRGGARACERVVVLGVR